MQSRSQALSPLPPLVDQGRQTREGLGMRLSMNEVEHVPMMFQDDDFISQWNDVMIS